MATIPGTLNTNLTDEQVLEAFDNALKHTPSDSTPKEDGSGSAGEEETFARSDHEHPHDTTKQDTLAFEGTYNASTNKVATMSAVKDGKLTGYAQTSGNVAETDKIIEAIGKVEKKADTNKTNILTLADSGGAKNVLQLSIDEMKAHNTSGATWNGNACTINGITFTVNADYTITVTGTLTSGSERALFRLFRDRPNSYGGMRLTGCPQDGGQPKWQLILEQMSYPYASIAQDEGNGATVSNNTSTNIYGYINIRTTSAVNLTFKPMICTKAQWDISHTYQPYAMSNVELTELAPIVKSKSTTIGTTYTLIDDVTQTIPNGKIARVSATLVFNNAAPRGLILSTSNNSSAFDNNLSLLAKVESTEHAVITVDVIKPNYSASPQNVYVWAKSSSSSSNSVYSTLESLSSI